MLAAGQLITAAAISYADASRPVGPEVLDRLFDRQAIHTGTSLVGFDVFPRRDHVLTRECLLEQVRSP